MGRVPRRHRQGDCVPLTDLTVEAETDDFGELYDGKVASDLQESVVIADGEVSGTLKYIEGGLDPSGTGPLAGSGWFLALKWSDIDETATSLKVGLTPTEGTGLVECLDDTDHNGVFKIASTDQFVTFVQADEDGTENWQNFSLRGLTLEAAE